MKLSSLFSFIIVLAVTLGGCSTPATNPTETASVMPYPTPVRPDETTGYPYPNVVVEPYPISAYPYPQSGQELILMATQGPIPSPASDFGVVTGILLVNGKPLVDKNVYLAEVLKDSTGEYSVASFDRANSPRAFTDSDGRFVFSNVTPGSYGIVLDFVVSSLILGNPKGSGPMIFEVEAGKTKDFNSLDYPELPIPQ